MGSYRDKLDIIADILHVAKGGAKKTQIMYGANLSYRVLTKYLREVIEAYLVRFERKHRHYMLTTKGRKFLERYKDYSKRNRHVERQLNNVRVERRALEELCSSS